MGVGVGTTCALTTSVPSQGSWANEDKNTDLTQSREARIIANPALPLLSFV